LLKKKDLCLDAKGNTGKNKENFSLELFPGWRKRGTQPGKAHYGSEHRKAFHPERVFFEPELVKIV